MQHQNTVVTDTKTRNLDRANELGIIVSPQDIDLIENHLWSLDGNGYTQTWIDGKIVSLHRLVHSRMTGRPLSEYTRDDHVRHIDPNPVDCRRENLWVHTSRMANQHDLNRKVNSNNTSGIKGVSWHKQTSKWQVQIYWNNRNIGLGLFDTLELAGRVASHCQQIRHNLTKDNDSDIGFEGFKALVLAERDEIVSHYEATR